MHDSCIYIEKMHDSCIYLYMYIAGKFNLIIHSYIYISAISANRRCIYIYIYIPHLLTCQIAPVVMCSSLPTYYLSISLTYDNYWITLNSIPSQLYPHSLTHRFSFHLIYRCKYDKATWPGQEGRGRRVCGIFSVTGPQETCLRSPGADCAQCYYQSPDWCGCGYFAHLVI